MRNSIKSIEGRSPVTSLIIHLLVHAIALNAYPLGKFYIESIGSLMPFVNSAGIAEQVTIPNDIILMDMYIMISLLSDTQWRKPMLKKMWDFILADRLHFPLLLNVYQNPPEYLCKQNSFVLFYFAQYLLQQQILFFSDYSQIGLPSNPNNKLSIKQIIQLIQWPRELIYNLFSSSPSSRFYIIQQLLSAALLQPDLNGNITSLVIVIRLNMFKSLLIFSFIFFFGTSLGRRTKKHRNNSVFMLPRGYSKNNCK